MAVSCGRGFCGVENCDEQLSHPLWLPFWRPQEKAGRRIDDRLVCEPMPFQGANPFLSVFTFQFTFQDHGEVDTLFLLGCTQYNFYY